MAKKYFTIAFLMMLSCGEKPQEKPIDVEWSQAKSAKMSKELTLDEEIDIKLFLEQHKDWKMTKTGTGLQYFIYKNGVGDSAKTGRLALVNYTISLLNGTVCYTSEKGELEKFVIDHSEIETGIQEGIKKLKVGDHAKFVIPSHLAHGLVGDMDKIPPLNPIIVDLELVNLR